jgi:hypothetical protein
MLRGGWRRRLEVLIDGGWTGFLTWMQDKLGVLLVGLGTASHCITVSRASLDGGESVEALPLEEGMLKRAGERTAVCAAHKQCSCYEDQETRSAHPSNRFSNYSKEPRVEAWLSSGEAYSYLLLSQSRCNR